MFAYKIRKSFDELCPYNEITSELEVLVLWRTENKGNP